jgi:hypothetical protein
MLTDAIGSAEADAAARMLREAEVEARRLLDATDAALHEDGDRLLQPREQFADPVGAAGRGRPAGAVRRRRRQHGPNTSQRCATHCATPPRR